MSEGRSKRIYATDISEIKSTAPRVDRPQPGFYKLRLVRGGPFVGARIWIESALDPETGQPIERPDMMFAEIDGKSVNPMNAWPRVLGRPITADEYAYLMGVREWAEKHDPTAPEAKPKETIDHGKVKPIF